jgi:hypothetical protein
MVSVVPLTEHCTGSSAEVSVHTALHPDGTVCDPLPPLKAVEPAPVPPTDMPSPKEARASEFITVLFVGM